MDWNLLNVFGGCAWHEPRMHSMKQGRNKGKETAKRPTIEVLRKVTAWASQIAAVSAYPGFTIQNVIIPVPISVSIAKI
jgi:hypothetical protein